MRMPSRLDADRNYRRGAIMGLTVAEAFMLIAFALLMMLALWRYETDIEREVMESQIRAVEEVRRTLESAFSEYQRNRAIGTACLTLGR